MTRRLCRLLALVLLAAIPLQGISAVVMPLCKVSQSPQSAAVEHTEHHGEHAQHGHSTADANDDAQHSKHKSDSKSGLGCDNCTPCHLVCSPMIHAVAAEFGCVPNVSFQPYDSTLYRPLSPERPLHPPRIA